MPKRMVEGPACRSLAPLHHAAHGPPPRSGEDLMTWKVTLPCTRAEAEALKEDIAAVRGDGRAAGADDQRGGRRGLADGRLFRGGARPRGHRPAAAASCRARAGAEPEAERLGDEDWVTLEPGRARADPRRPLLRPHARASRRGPAGRDRLRDRRRPRLRHRPARDHHRLPDRARPAEGDRRERRQSRRYRHRHRPARLRRHALWPAARAAPRTSTRSRSRSRRRMPRSTVSGSAARGASSS